MHNPSPSIWGNSVRILVPAYKAERELAAFLPELLQRVPPSAILVIDDASSDNTPSLCAEHAIACISHETNRGKGAALKTGFKKLLNEGARWIITMDADGQHRPSDLTAFLVAIALQPQAGIIIGNREKHPGVMPPARIFSNRSTSWLLSQFCGQTIRDAQCGYRAYNTELLKQITLVHERFEMESEVILRSCALGMHVEFVAVQTIYSKDISSHIRHVRDTARWIAAVVSVRAALRTKKNNRA